MFDEGQGDRSAQGSAVATQGMQWSLLELFFITTLVACAIALNQFVSQFLAMGLGAAAVVVAAVRWSSCENPILSGLVGFASSLIVSFVVVGAAKLDASAASALVIIGSGTGYLAGVFWSEFSNAA